MTQTQSCSIRRAAGSPAAARTAPSRTHTSLPAQTAARGRQPPTTRQQPGGRWADRGPGSSQREQRSKRCARRCTSS